MRIEIPNFKSGVIDIRHVVTDYTGTFSCGGEPLQGVLAMFPQIIRNGFRIHVITSDAHGTVKTKLAHVVDNEKVVLLKLEGENHAQQKKEYVETLGTSNVVAIGNGRNDVLMLKAAQQGGGLAIGVQSGEGMATALYHCTDLVFADAAAAFRLLTTDGTGIRGSLHSP